MNIFSSLETTPVRNFGEGITCVLKFTSFLDSCSNSHNGYNVIYFKNLQLQSPNQKNNKDRNTKYKQFYVHDPGSKQIIYEILCFKYDVTQVVKINSLSFIEDQWYN
jgi:hypothetical protein